MTATYFNTDTEILEIEKTKIDTVDTKDLIVFNDNVNTFDNVIDALISVCELTPEQAEQCTLIIHYKGKYGVKKGSFDTLAPMRNAICNRGISAEVM